MGYADVSVIVEGALDAEETFETDTQEGRLALASWLGNLEREANSEGFTAEVWVQHHEHSLEVEGCECAQYETDHHPDHVFGPKKEER